MKKIIPFLLLCVSVEASAEPVVLRQSEDTYALVGEGTVVTKDCTVTAEGTLTASLVRERNKSWIVFHDRDGAEEAQCEVRIRISRPHRQLRVAVRR